MPSDSHPFRARRRDNMRGIVYFASIEPDTWPSGLQSLLTAFVSSYPRVATTPELVENFLAFLRGEGNTDTRGPLDNPSWRIVLSESTTYLPSAIARTRKATLTCYGGDSVSIMVQPMQVSLGPPQIVESMNPEPGTILSMHVVPDATVLGPDGLCVHFQYNSDRLLSSKLLDLIIWEEMIGSGAQWNTKEPYITPNCKIEGFQTITATAI